MYTLLKTCTLNVQVHYHQRGRLSCMGGHEGSVEDVVEDWRRIRKKEERKYKKNKKKEQKCPVCVKIRQGVLMCMCVGSRYCGRQLQGRELGGSARVWRRRSSTRPWFTAHTHTTIGCVYCVIYLAKRDRLSNVADGQTDLRFFFVKYFCLLLASLETRTCISIVWKHKTMKLCLRREIAQRRWNCPLIY